MPEGAEVRMLEEALKAIEGKCISSCTVVSGRYKRAAIHDLDTLPGKIIKHVTAKGKLLVFHVHGGEDPIAVLSTMGMTGWWFVLKTGEPHELDKYRRIELAFDDGTVAAFFDPRNFGTLKVVSHNEAKRKLAELGPDIMMEEHLWNTVAIPEFMARVARFGRKQNLAEGLLDQRIASGCGNYIRADAMYLAHLDPTMPMLSMTEEQLRLIWKCMNKVATCSFNNKAVDGDGEFENLVYGFDKSPAGHKVTNYVDANGRTVWYSPREQMKPLWITVEGGDVFEGHQGHWADCFFSNATRYAIEAFLNEPGTVDNTSNVPVKYTIREMTDEEIAKYPGLVEFCEGLEF